MASPMINLVNEFIIVPALCAVDIYSENRADLVLKIGAAETLYRTQKQGGGGPARSWWQMEPKTHNDIWSTFLGQSHRKNIVDGLSCMSYAPGDIKELTNNPWYAAAMCGIHFLRFKEPLPEAGETLSQAEYWKKYYNTSEGKGTISGFLENVTYLLGGNNV